MNRRSFVSMAFASTVAMASGIGRSENTDAADSQIKYPEDQQNLKARWEKLDTAIRGWWDGDLHRATLHWQRCHYVGKDRPVMGAVQRRRRRPSCSAGTTRAAAAARIYFGFSGGGRQGSIQLGCNCR